MPEPYGSFGWICRHAPLPQCNLLFEQLWGFGSHLNVLFPATSAFYASYNVTSLNVPEDTNAALARAQAGVGVGADCVIARVQERGSLGDLVLVIVSVVSIIVAACLVFHALRRKTAVGRGELCTLYLVFALHCALQALTTSSMLEQGSSALVVLSAIHCGTLAALSTILIFNVLVYHKVIEDNSLLPVLSMLLLSGAIFGGTVYIALATAYRWAPQFTFATMQHAANLQSIGLFTLTLVWPLLAILIFVAGVFYIIYSEGRRTLAYVVFGAAVVAILGGQIAVFVASQPLCKVSSSTVNGAFIGAIANTAAVILLHGTWLLLTEDLWEDTRRW